MVIGFFFLWLVAQDRGQAKPEAGWANYGSDAGGTRYSPAAQIVALLSSRGLIDHIDDLAADWSI